MSAFLRKYAVLTAAGTNIGIPMIKAGVADFATGSDWTPAAGDVKVSIDGGTQANIGTLPSYANGQWTFVLTALELTGKSIRVAIVDSATKAVEDNFFIVETYGNASALHVFDLGSAAGADTSGTTTLLSRLSAQRGTNLDNLDAAVSTRSTFAGGAVASVTDKTGFKLASDGLDLISAALPTGVATTFPGKLMQLWHRFYGKATRSTTQLRTYAADGTTVLTTQTISDDGAGNEVQGIAS